MATSKDFAEFCAETVEELGSIRYRKMFGEYLLYIDEKPVLLICDNSVFIKKLECLSSFDLPCGVPYEGAKEHYVLPIDDRECVLSACRAALPFLTVPRKRIKAQR